MAKGNTRDPAAFDAYLRASKALQDVRSLTDLYAPLALYTEAVKRDPNYALAFSGRSTNLEAMAEFELGKPDHRDLLDRSEADARRAIALAPDMAQGHLALAFVFQHKLDLVHASEEYERAVTLERGNARVLRNYGIFAVTMGHSDAGITAARRAVVVDPLNPISHLFLSYSLYLARRYEDALQAVQDAGLPASVAAFESGQAYYALGDFERARISYELGEAAHRALGTRDTRLAMVYDKLGRHADATAVLAKVKKQGYLTAFQSAMVYAQWGATAKALDSLEAAAQIRDPDLARLRVEPLFDPLRKEPRFLAIERELQFPP
jgi:tetratricopeptide (TPR) repeat protein